jgi:hypothetical protein
MKVNIKEIIRKTVNSHQGIKSVELVLEVMQQASDMNITIYEDALMELIEERGIVEIEYTLPQMDYRVKSLYLPKDTIVVVSKA